MFYTAFMLASGRYFTGKTAETIRYIKTIEIFLSSIALKLLIVVGFLFLTLISILYDSKEIEQCKY